MRPASPKRLCEGGLFAAALVTRALYLFIFHPPLESYYLGLADSLLSTGVLGFEGAASTAFEPGYPIFLASARLMFGDRMTLIQLLQAAVSAAGTVLLYDLTRQLTSSQRAAVAAGALFAVHPLLVKQASAASDLGITTTLLVAFALAFVRIRSRRGAALSGLILGMTVLTRSMVAPVVALAVTILLVRGQVRHAIALGLTAAAVIAPMVARTYVLSGSLVPTRSGVALYVGNSPHSAPLLPTYDLDLLELEAYERFTRAHPDVDPEHREFAATFDAFLTRQAIAHMTERPWATLRQKMLNVVYLLSPRISPLETFNVATRVRIQGDTVVGVEGSVPRHWSEIAAYAVASAVLLVGCVSGVYLRRRDLPRDAILWAIFATFTIVNAMYLPATRYTGPMHLLLIFYTAVAIARLREGFRHAAVA